jgi:hypothetical protein
LAFSAALGCSQSPYELAEVRGTVLVDGHPLPRAKVMFAPVEGAGGVNPGKPAFGLMQPEGSFVLTTYDKDDGAIVGEHWVSIISMEGDDASTRPANNRQLRFSRLNLPEKCSVVAGQVNRFDIRLTYEDVARLSGQSGR